MKPESIQRLTQALALLPPAPNNHCLGHFICALLYLKALSDSWYWHAEELKPAGLTPPEFATAMAQRGVLVIPADAMFETCLAAPADKTVQSIQQAFIMLTNANPTLVGVLQPMQFSYLKGLYGPENTHAAKLVELLATLSQVSFEHHAPSLALSAEFAVVIQTVCRNSNDRAQAVARLLANLVAPRAGEVALDLACGQGNLLIACAQKLARTQPLAKMQLVGSEEDLHQWVLANMRLSLAGVAHDQLQHTNALRTPFNELGDAAQALALGGADMVVMAIPETHSTWNLVLANQARDPRFPWSAPFDSRLALIWLGLAALKTETGRMALIMPMHVLDAFGGDDLRKRLVDSNLLDAVIQVPLLGQQVMLVIRTQKTHTNIAFIQTYSHGSERITDAWHAYQHFQAGQPHVNLVCLDKDAVVANHYQFNIEMYMAAARELYAKAVTKVLPR